MNRRNFLNRSALVAVSSAAISVPILRKNLPVKLDDYKAGVSDFWIRSILDGKLIRSETSTYFDSTDEVITIESLYVPNLKVIQEGWKRIDPRTFLINKEYEYVLVDTGDRIEGELFIAGTKLDVVLKCRVICVDQIVPTVEMLEHPFRKTNQVIISKFKPI